MDEPRSRTQLPSESELARTSWRDWQWLALLVMLALPVRLWLVYNTEVAARDSVGFIRYALQFDDRSWGDVVRGFHQAPGYPVAVWLASLPLRAWTGEVTPDVMRLSAQLVSVIAALLMTLPMYLLGKALWDARIGFGAALLFQWLPTSSHHLSDGISEALFLLFVAWGLLAAVRALHTHRAGWFAVCGVAAALAYLTRPEGTLVALAAGATMLALQLSAARRQTWTALTRQLACLTVPALALAAPYMWTIGGFTNKPSILKAADTLVTNDEPTPRLPGLRAQVWGDSFTDVTAMGRRLLLGLWAIFNEVGNAFHYVGAIPVIVALIVRGRSLWRPPGLWVLTVYLALHAAALLVLALSAGYLSDRHLMPVVMMFCYLAMLGIVDLGGWAAAWLGRTICSGAMAARSVRTAPMALLGIYLLLCLPQTLKRLHGNRAGNHEAGVWLAQRLQPGDIVLDDHAWSNYYAGQVFLEGKEPALPRGATPTCYVVMTRSQDPKVAAFRNRMERKLKLSDRSEIVFRWPSSATVEEARVVVHSVPRDPKLNPWTTVE